MTFSFKRALVTATLSLGLALPAAAQWRLDSANSHVHFLSTKNAQVTEVHQFHQIKGVVDGSGLLNIELDLSSVDTAIEIRNTRMKEILFEIAQHPVATFTAQLPQTMTSLSTGQTTTGSVKGTLTLHGEETPATFNVRASRLTDKTMVVSTIAPTIISASDFSLVDGLIKLQEIAGLNSITTAVPVTFSVAFNAE